jgi:lactosylceramide 4-alpha-galactosyltransferase
MKMKRTDIVKKCIFWVIFVFILIEILKICLPTTEMLSNQKTAIKESYDEQDKIKVPISLDSFLVKKYDIYFIESADNKLNFDYRQLCSIESAAKHNPHASINIKSIKARIESNHYLYLLKIYPNIRFEIIEPAELFNDTPLEKWWTRQFISKNPYYQISHRSDALRYALLYKYGGIYSDLDSITLRSFQPLLNYSGFPLESKGSTPVVTGSFFIMPKKHRLLYQLMEYFVVDYNPDDWNAVGPKLITKLLARYCNRTNAELLVGKKSNTCDLVTFPYTLHTPFHWLSIKKLFDPEEKLNYKDLVNAYQIHFNSFLTRDIKISWKSDSVFEFIAANNCPLVNHLAFSEQTAA